MCAFPQGPLWSSKTTPWKFETLFLQIQSPYICPGISPICPCSYRSHGTVILGPGPKYVPRPILWAQAHIRPGPHAEPLFRHILRWCDPLNVMGPCVLYLIFVLYLIYLSYIGYLSYLICVLYLIFVFYLIYLSYIGYLSYI